MMRWPAAARQVGLVDQIFTSWNPLTGWMRLFGRCEARSGIAAFDRLVEQVMGEQPYRSARRVCWITDNGSAHRGAKGDRRLQTRWPNVIPIHTPCHASWLNLIPRRGFPTGGNNGQLGTGRGW
ncbi:MAG TPA: hypothetical protein PKK95_06040 [Vicinamibacterales bacterium]|nr:hypothetical protein [Acidobacteriota bacterium]HOC17806.1 hypothetical protein [Vicinamibacterales bacterium]